MFKESFVPCEGIYLLNHSVGRMPVSARSQVEESFFAAWESGTPDAWPRWMEAIVDFKSALAKLFNSEASAFCPQVNISSAMTKIIYSLPPKAGKDVIVLTENDFPSVAFTLAQAQRQGYKLKIIPAVENVQKLDAWEQALTADVHSVLINHVHFNTSKLIPVGDITRLARSRNITSVVDVAQSSGIVPIDLQQWDADIVMGSCVKWLCGGPGAGFLWVNPNLINKLEPRDVGWFSHQNPFEFDIHNFQYASDSSRFWGGTPSVLPYALASNSINLIHEIGVDVIREHNWRLTQKIVDNVNPACLQTPANPNRRGGTLVLKFEDQEKVENALTQAGVLFDSRALGLRLSPHIYNSESEIDTVISCLKD